MPEKGFTTQNYDSWVGNLDNDEDNNTSELPNLDLISKNQDRDLLSAQ